MTETRKQIIELIEPYMEKDLSFGCIIEHNPKGRHQHDSDICVMVRKHQDGYRWINYTTIGEEGTEYDGMYSWTEKDELKGTGYGENDNLKIVGHYDITAVLKYIKSVMGNNNIKYVGMDDVNIIFQNTKTDIYRNIYIKLKPLHLYTEQEEKDLLELLQKLNNTPGSI